MKPEQIRAIFEQDNYEFSKGVIKRHVPDGDTWEWKVVTPDPATGMVSVRDSMGAMRQVAFQEVLDVMGDNAVTNILPTKERLGRIGSSQNVSREKRGRYYRVTDLQRAKIAKMLGEGTTVYRISKELKLKYPTVDNIRKKIKKTQK